MTQSIKPIRKSIKSIKSIKFIHSGPLNPPSQLGVVLVLVYCCTTFHD